MCLLRHLMVFFGVLTMEFCWVIAVNSVKEKNYLTLTISSVVLHLISYASILAVVSDQTVLITTSFATILGSIFGLWYGSRVKPS